MRRTRRRCGAPVTAPGTAEGAAAAQVRDWTLLSASFAEALDVLSVTRTRM
ncbi:MAG TPA: hypothetical protein VMS76_17405 [Planctomycetota bacterium]|nr:hypothetical protein [Planctomycetota bacterium]